MQDLVLDVDCSAGRRAGLEAALRTAIRAGRLLPGAVLPSTRVLAADLGFARATVVAAFEQLVAEGYLTARQGVGTTIAPWHAPPPVHLRPTAQRRALRADFRPGEPDNGAFPRAAWLRSVRRIVNESPDSLFGYADTRGLAELRVALAQYLGRARAVYAQPEAVSVFGGATAAMSVVAETLNALGVERIGVEDPMLVILRDVVAASGLSLVPIPLDEEGIDIDALEHSGVGAVVVGPAHQYPLGITMTPGRRRGLVSWARRSDAWIIEDDYDGEFRFDRQPIGALQGLDPERVLYCGTASKSLAAGLRIAWLVAPRPLRARLLEIKHLRSSVSSIDQAALADFIERGELDRHLRNVRAVYLRRQRRLVDALRTDVPWLQVSGAAAGLHLLVTFDPERRFGTSRTDGSLAAAEAWIVDAAAEQSIALLGLSDHWLGTPTQCGLVLGYSRPAQHAFDAALARLVAFLRSCWLPARPGRLGPGQFIGPKQ